MQMLKYICKKLGTYVQSVKSLAKLLCDLYRSNPAMKWNSEPKTIKAFQKLLGYGNYYSFKKQVYAIMIVSMYGNLAEIVDDPDAHMLRLLPQTIVLDPPEQVEFNSFLEELKSEFKRRTTTLILTPIGSALGAAGGAYTDKDCPSRGALIWGCIGSFSSLVVGTIIDVCPQDFLLSIVGGLSPILFGVGCIVASELSKGNHCSSSSYVR
jgi:hypothetical protein